MYVAWLCLASWPQGSEGDPECIFFTLNTYQATFILVTFCDTTAGNGPSFQTHRHTNERTDGWTDRRGSWNSYLDGGKVYLGENWKKINLFENSENTWMIIQRKI